MGIPLLASTSYAFVSTSSNSSGYAVFDLTKNFHPTGTYACAEGFLNNNTVIQVSCPSQSTLPKSSNGPVQISKISNKESSTGGPLPLSSRSQNPTLACNTSTCFGGWTYTTSGPYEAMYVNSMNPTSSPSSSYTTPKATFWIGLENTAATIIVQSGEEYGNGYSSNTVYLYDEIQGPYYQGTRYCGSTAFCGTGPFFASRGDPVSYGEYVQSGYWYATLTDSHLNPSIEIYTVRYFCARCKYIGGWPFQLRRRRTYLEITVAISSLHSEYSFSLDISFKPDFNKPQQLGSSGQTNRQRYLPHNHNRLYPHNDLELRGSKHSSPF